MLPDTWTPPSVKNMMKFPRIDIPDPDAVQRYRDWHNDHMEIPRTVPPVYKDFILTYTQIFPDRGGNPKTHIYIECVHYTDDLTGLYVCHVVDGIKAFVVMSDYNDYDGPRVNARASIPERTAYPRDWFENEASSALMLVLAVQNFLLYHRPEVIPKFLPEPKAETRRSKTDGKPKSKPKAKTVGDTITCYIRLDGDIPKNRTYTYRAIQWQVRGHYRHTTHDGKPAIIYIKPHLAKRGEKKSKPATTVLTATPKKECPNA